MAELDFLADPLLLKPLTKTRKENINLEDLSKEELIEKVKSLKLHVQQLRNVIANKDKSALPFAKKKQKGRKFDFNKYKRRRILLRVSYFGWDYCGFASQEDDGRTIESELFAALLQTKLVEDRTQSNYHRCGRTDKGVSGTGQAISIDVRTNLVEGVGIYEQEGYNGEQKEGDQEIDFCTVLNRNLPEDIRVTGWAPAPRLDFSARFDCDGRSYKYIFPRGQVDIVRMEQAGQLLLGEHDYRNFCRMDVNNGIVKFVRRIDSVVVECVDREVPSQDGPYDMCCLIISGKAYLWHQIRCIMSVLLMVGEGLEEEDVITQLLDVEKHPCRPAYQMASDLPLNLFSARYEGVVWQSEQVSMEFILKSMQKLWTQNAVKATMVRETLKELEKESGLSVVGQLDILTGRRWLKSYTKLLQLPVCPSLADKVRTVVKRRKIDITQKTEEEKGDEVEDMDS
eukprot:GFUD01014448.1.p1 GENE.GFUD01014448.1~~GFUD01014448.1.p1  ORF type:complete len:455 (+),score=149.97 GFUD01014448.1:106-1470(+)